MTRWKDTLPELKEDGTLIDAAGVLVGALRHDGLGYTMHRDARAQYAAARIRAVRKKIEAEHGEGSDRQRGLPALLRDEELLWYALQHSATAGRLLEHDDFTLGLYFLRCAEAALRTLWRRGQE